MKIHRYVNTAVWGLFAYPSLSFRGFGSHVRRERISNLQYRVVREVAA